MHTCPTQFRSSFKSSTLTSALSMYTDRLDFHDEVCGECCAYSLFFNTIFIACGYHCCLESRKPDKHVNVTNIFGCFKQVQWYGRITLWTPCFNTCWKSISICSSLLCQKPHSKWNGRMTAKATTETEQTAWKRYVSCHVSFSTKSIVLHWVIPPSSLWRLLPPPWERW